MWVANEWIIKYYPILSTALLFAIFYHFLLNWSVYISKKYYYKLPASLWSKPAVANIIFISGDAYCILFRICTTISGVNNKGNNKICTFG
jgi:hypothetical protein